MKNYQLSDYLLPTEIDQIPRLQEADGHLNCEVDSLLVLMTKKFTPQQVTCLRELLLLNDPPSHTTINRLAILIGQKFYDILRLLLLLQAAPHAVAISRELPEVWVNKIKQIYAAEMPGYSRSFFFYFPIPQEIQKACKKLNSSSTEVNS